MLRKQVPALRSQESYYHNLQSDPAGGTLLYRRGPAADAHVAVVALNFSDAGRMVQAPFPAPGTYREMIDDDVRSHNSTHYDVSIAAAGQQMPVTVPANYGFVFVRQ